MQPILAVLPDRPDFWTDVQYQTVGMIVVFSALISIWLCLELVGALFRTVDRRRANAAAAASTAQTPDDPALTIVAAAAAAYTAGENDHIVAVISAAVHATAGRAARIISIQPLDASGAPDAGRAAWSHEGRRQIYHSHKLR